MGKLFARKAGTTALGGIVSGTDSPPTPEMVKIHQIVRSGDLQVRAKINRGWVDKLATQIDNGVEMDPITLVRIAGEDRLYLVKGFHRVSAAEKIGRESISAIIIDGTLEDAVEMALKSNAKHGQPLTAADRRRKIVMAFDHYGLNTSDNFIAKATGTYPKLVAGVRAEIGAADATEINDTLSVSTADVPATDVVGVAGTASSAIKSSIISKKDPPRKVKVRRGKQTYEASVGDPFARGKDLVPALHKYLSDCGENPLEVMGEIIQGKSACNDRMEDMRSGNYFPDGFRVRKASVIAGAKMVLASEGHVKVPRDLWEMILRVLGDASPELFKKVRGL